MSGLVAFWLLPRGSAAERLQATITALAARHGSVAFEPHVTVHAATVTPTDAALAVEAVASATAPYRVRFERAAVGDALSQTLVLTGPASERTETIARRLAELTGPAAVPLPALGHLSLLYASLRPEERAALLRDVRAPIEDVELGELVAVSIPRPFTRPDDVRDWHVTARSPLSG